MSFWAGVVQGVKDVDVLKEKEALAEERKAADAEAKAYRDKIFEYNARRDAAADERAGTKFTWEQEDRLQAQLASLTVPGSDGGALTGGAKGSPTRGGPGAKGPNINAVLDRATKVYKVSTDTLTPLLGQGTSAAAIDELLNEYDSFVKAYEGKPGTVPTADEFLSDSTIAFTPGTEVTDEMVIASAKRLGVKLTDRYGQTGSTWEEAITAQLKRQAGSGAYSFTSPSAPTPLDSGEVNELVKAASEEITPFLTERVARLQAKLAAQKVKDPATARELAAAVKALEGYKDNTDTRSAINEFGADVILPMLANASPDAIGVNNFGKFNPSIRNRTYPNGTAVVEAYNRGELPEDGYYVIKNTIYQVDPVGIKSAAYGPFNQEGKQGSLGTAIGELPTGGGGTGPLDLTGLSESEMQRAIVESGLTAGSPILVDGKVVPLAQASIDMSNQATAGPSGRDLDADNLIGSAPEGRGGATGEPQAPLTAADVREQSGDVVKTLGEGIGAVQNFTQTAGGVADVGAAYALTPFSMLQNATSLTLASILDAAGLTENADRLYQAVADSVNGRQETRESGLVSSMLESDTVDVDILDFMANTFGFNKEDLADKPEAMKAISELESDVRQRIGTVGFQDTGLRPAESEPQGAPEGPSDTNLERMEQSRLGRVGMESDRLSTESKSMPNGYRPTQMSATELNLPKVRSTLDAITAEYVEDKGAPLAPDEELAVGIEAIVDALTGGGVDQGDLDNLIIELNTKYGEDKVREALDLAMNA